MPVSELCEQHHLQPTVFYRWQRQLFEQGAAAFQSNPNREATQLKQKIGKLEEKVAKKNEVLGELMEAHIELKKKSWGRMKTGWRRKTLRNEVVDFVHHWVPKVPISQQKMLKRIGIGSSKFYDWEQRYGQDNRHNASLPRKWWLADWEKEAIVNYYDQHPDEGYRSLSYQMLDEEVVAVSPSSVYRVLKNAGRLKKWDTKPSQKGTGFQQPESHMSIGILTYPI